MAGKKGNNYFQIFENLVNYSCEAASMLQEILNDFDVSTISAKIDEMHKVEHEADLKKHDMMDKLVKEFITPLEREDIIALSHEIDNVTDAVEEVLLRIYMYNIQSIPEEAKEFAGLIVKSCDLLKKVMQEFANYKKSTMLYRLIIEINDIEEEADRLYTLSIRDLYLKSKDTIEIMTWTETFERFEKCCDASESVANLIETIVMKNS